MADVINLSARFSYLIEVLLPRSSPVIPICQRG